MIFQSQSHNHDGEGSKGAGKAGLALCRVERNLIQEVVNCVVEEEVGLGW